MKYRRIFDVLVVYSSGLALSASEKSQTGTPFSATACVKDYDLAYAYLFEMITSHELKVAFATSEDIIAAGTVSSYWLYRDSQWQAINEAGYAAIIFDKLSPQTELKAKQRKLLFSAPEIKSFNDPSLYNLFFDKLKLANTLTTATIPTVMLDSTDSASTRVARDRLQTLIDLYSKREDFSNDYILKDRYGSAGNHVYHIAHDKLCNLNKIAMQNPTKSFILQPMLLFDKGYQYEKWQGKTEIRLIYNNEKIVQTYLRISESKLGLCNGHQGGKIIYQPIASIPKRVMLAADRVISLLPKHDSLYALDFVVSNNGTPYLLEGNTGPGLNWDRENLADVAGAKKLMKIIARELAIKVERERPRKTILPIYKPVFVS